MEIKKRFDFKKALINLLSFLLWTILWPLFFAAFSPVAHAEAFQAKVFPSSIRQGDAFMVMVSGLKGTTVPSATFNKGALRFSSCGKGCFVALGAVDLNAEPGAYRIPLRTGKRKTTLRLRVSEGEFETINLTLSEDKVSPGPEAIERINREAALLSLIWEIDSERLWQGVFVLPLANPLSTPFGTKRIINGETVSIHRGLDMKGAEGEEIYATNTGRVVLTEELFFGGNTVVLDHGQGIFTVYMHMSQFNVGPGDLVSKNDVLGFVGSTGRSSGPHLHFGVKVMGMNTDPVSITRLKL
jgi:murein DD-endopeptidase MepM/ murein hydrolase activator NlpD